MTVNTVDDALLEINRLRAINQQLLAALNMGLQLLRNSRAGKNPDVNQAAIVLYDAITEAERTP